MSHKVCISSSVKGFLSINFEPFGTGSHLEKEEAQIRKEEQEENEYLKACTLYSNSNLNGFTYQYKNNTSVVILQNVYANVDKIRVRVNGRIAYVDVSNYKK